MKAEKEAPVMISELSGSERKALQHLLAFYNQTATYSDGMKERLKRLPNGWRDWRLMVKLAEKLLRELYKTLTPRHYQQMKLLEQHGECAVIIKPATKAERVEFVHEKALDVVIKCCIDANCGVCVKNDAEVRGCKLRKALFDIKAPMEIPRYGCVYRDIVHDESWKKDMKQCR